MYGEVESTERLTPSMVRVVLGGGDLKNFAPTEQCDQYINAQFVPAGALYTAPFDDGVLDGIEAKYRPRPRRYTVRHWDHDRKQLTIDFVAHGDDGFAGPWAQAARPGDRLQFKGPRGSFRPNPAAEWYLFAGDESALPAIAACLEALSPAARAVVLLVVDGPDDELTLTAPANSEIVWLHRRSADEPPALLPDAVAALDWAAGPVDIFVHGEAAEVRAVRKHLISVRGIDPADASISPYWRRTMTDEQWRAVKAQWVADQANDT